MLQLINADLIDIAESESRSQYPGYRYNLVSPQSIVRYSAEHTEIPVARHIMSISLPLKTEDPAAKLKQIGNSPLALKVYDNDKGIPIVEARVLDNSMENRANLYVIAYPYKGKLSVIPESPLYRIYKGVSVYSVRPFWYENTRYHNCLYLVVEPNLNLFKPEHKYHQDKIDIKIESSYYHQDRADNKWYLTTNSFAVIIQNGAGEYVVVNESHTEESEPPEDFNTRGSRGQEKEDLWTTFKFYPKDENGERKPDGERRRRFRTQYQTPNFSTPSSKVKKNGQRESYIDGDMRITTNRHGIRKEIPLHRSDNFGNRGSYSKKGQQSDLDRMIQKSGMRETDRMFEDENRQRRRGSRPPRKDWD